MQTNTRANIEVGLEGELYGDFPHFVQAMKLESGIAKFGRGVILGSEDDEFVVPSSAITVDELYGITVRSSFKERLYKQTEDPYFTAVDEDRAGILKTGFIWVIPTTVLAKRGPIHMQHTANGTLEVGTFRNAVDGTNTLDVSSVISVHFGSLVIGEPACLRVNIWK